MIAFIWMALSAVYFILYWNTNKMACIVCALLCLNMGFNHFDHYEVMRELEEIRMIVENEDVN